MSNFPHERPEHLSDAPREYYETGPGAPAEADIETDWDGCAAPEGSADYTSEEDLQELDFPLEGASEVIEPVVADEIDVDETEVAARGTHRTRDAEAEGADADAETAEATETQRMYETPEPADGEQASEPTGESTGETYESYAEPDEAPAELPELDDAPVDQPESVKNPLFERVTDKIFEGAAAGVSKLIRELERRAAEKAATGEEPAPHERSAAEAAGDAPTPASQEAAAAAAGQQPEADKTDILEPAEIKVDVPTSVAEADKPAPQETAAAAAAAETPNAAATEAAADKPTAASAAAAEQPPAGNAEVAGEESSAAEAAVDRGKYMLYSEADGWSEPETAQPVQYSAAASGTEAPAYYGPEAPVESAGQLVEVPAGSMAVARSEEVGGGQDPLVGATAQANNVVVSFHQPATGEAGMAHFDPSGTPDAMPMLDSMVQAAPSLNQPNVQVAIVGGAPADETQPHLGEQVGAYLRANTVITDINVVHEMDGRDTDVITDSQSGLVQAVPRDGGAAWYSADLAGAEGALATTGGTATGDGGGDAAAGGGEGGGDAGGE